MRLKIIICVVVLGIATLAILIAMNIGISTSNKLPDPISSKISEMTSECREVGGIPNDSPEVLTIGDFNGDGVSDYIINPMAYNCTGGESLFSGSAGTIMTVYIGNKYGKAYENFRSIAHDVEVNNTVKPAKLRMSVEGTLCGQDTSEIPHSDYQVCWRTIVWDKSKQKFDFAPLSEAEFDD